MPMYPGKETIWVNTFLEHTFAALDYSLQTSIEKVNIGGNAGNTKATNQHFCFHSDEFDRDNNGQ